MLTQLKQNITGHIRKERYLHIKIVKNNKTYLERERERGMWEGGGERRDGLIKRKNG